MTNRSASCAECGELVVVTNAVPVIRAGRVGLLCKACAPSPGQRWSEMGRESVSDGDEPEYETILVGSGGADDSSRPAAVSGSIEKKR